MTRRSALRISLAAALWFGLHGASQGLDAFPGAEGFGAASVGGHGGKLVHVTTLADSGPGSLRWALENRSDPRIVVFDVAGTIDLETQIRVGSRVTLAGQTAPAPGIVVTGARLQVVGDDVTIRGMRLRPGIRPEQTPGSMDGLSVGAKDRVVRRVIIDHNSISWATDENLTTWFEVEDVTFSNNLIAQGLDQAGHPKGEHSMGMLLGENSRRVSVLRNLLYGNKWRNPQVQSVDPAEFVNNLVVSYGPGGLSAIRSPVRLDVVNNVFLAGPETPERETRSPIALIAHEPGDAFYVRGNVTPMGLDVTRGQGAANLVDAPVAGSGTVPLPTDEVAAHVLANAGALAPERDATDRALVALAKAQAGSFIDRAPEDAPKASPTAAPPADSDGDGIPDAAEAALGTDPARADARKAGATGYPALEDYLNGLLSQPSAEAP